MKRALVLLILIFPVFLITANPMTSINDTFLINPDEYVFYEVLLEKNETYWISITGNNTWILITVNNTNFQLFQQKESFYSLENNHYSFLNGKFWIPTGGFANLTTFYEETNEGEAIFILYNSNEDILAGEIEWRKKGGSSTYIDLLSLGLVVPCLALIRKVKR